MAFDIDLWRSDVQRRARRFIRNPQGELLLYATDRLLHYLGALAFEPFFQAYATQPLRGVVALSQLTQAEGTTFLIHNAASLRYNQAMLWNELDRKPGLRLCLEQVALRLDLIEYVLQELSDENAIWFRDTLTYEIEGFRQRGELMELRHALHEMPWQTRYNTIQALSARAGHYTPADIDLLRSAMRDRTAIVRSAAARQLGRIKNGLAPELRGRLFDLALYDRDVSTRYAAARALGMQRDHLIDTTSRELLTTALFHDDSFVRSAASIVLAQIGAALADPTILESLLAVLGDDDPYAREAAATALGAMGGAAATDEILRALTTALLDTDQYVHEAALAALRTLQPLHQDGGAQSGLV
ncbi:MAG TPA: HEAT repeat domain-containing protein [Herpetosiphonaceae bacterium]|nr:HEAT repeat domain-containing protein [Herpetosiphonaceae bacterium]